MALYRLTPGYQRICFPSRDTYVGHTLSVYELFLSPEASLSDRSVSRPRYSDYRLPNDVRFGKQNQPVCNTEKVFSLPCQGPTSLQQV